MQCSKQSIAKIIIAAKVNRTPLGLGLVRHFDGGGLKPKLSFSAKLRTNKQCSDRAKTISERLHFVKNSSSLEIAVKKRGN